MNHVVIECWLSGSTAMLQNRATEESLYGRTRQNTPGNEQDPRDICEAAVYRLPNKQLAVPGAAVARMLREAGGSHKAKGSRKSLKYIVPAAVIILDELCGLYLADRKTALFDYEVDSRPVTIPATKGRVMRHRARFNEWSFHVRLRINTTIMDETLVRRLASEGIQTIGIGDYRPEKGGPFGTGDVTSWAVISEAKPRRESERRNGEKHAA